MTSAEVTLKEKAESGKLPPASVAADCAHETLGERIREGVTYDTTSANQVEADVQAVSMARAYHRVIAPTVEPMIIEERLEAEVAPELVLSGQPDVVAREPQIIRDVKTSTRYRGSHAPQIGGYSLIAGAHGLAIDFAAIDSIKRVATGKPQPDPVSVDVRLREAETAAIRIVHHIAGDLKTFREGDPERRIRPGDPWAFIANPNSMLCNPKYCPAFGTDFCSEGDPAKLRR